MRTPIAVLASMALALAPGLAHAQVDADVADSGDTAFVLVAALLGLGLILPGLILHGGGWLRTRAFARQATHVTAIAALVALLWIVAGYTLAFGTVGSGWLGAGNAWMLADLGNVRDGTDIPESAFVLFGLAGAVVAAGLLSSAWAERGTLGWALPFTGLWSLIVYAPLTHWVRGGGWLASRLGTVDFAGGLVLHGSLGVSALVVALLIGRRAGLDANPLPAGHAPGLGLAGTGLIWAGLLALTGGSALAAGDDAAAAMLAALAGGATGALTWLLGDALTTGRTNPAALAQGALAGLASVSAGAAYVAPGGAICCALVGVALAWGAVRVLQRLAIDDPLHLFAVHGVAGLSGTALAALFLHPALGGTGYAEGMGPARQIVAQIVGIGAIGAWSAIGTAIAGLAVAMAVPMRISEAEELGETDAP